MVHLHARDKHTGEPTYDLHTYADIIAGIKRFSKDLIICVSTSGRTFRTFKERSEVLMIDGDLKPDMGSLTLSSLNFNNQASVSTPQMIRALAELMKDRGIKPELEAFDLGMINYSRYLIKKGILKPPYYFNLIFGNIACAQANPLSLGLMINELPDDSIFCIGGVGNYQLKMNMAGIIFADGIRIGLEDNIWYHTNRIRLATNIALLKRIHHLSESYGKKVMKPKHARSLLNL
jgi:uncharacterized protein (DUF849 family)